jgi:uncharacterized protein (DUF2236 family)
VGRRPPARGPLTKSDPGLFGPDSVTWRLDREAFLLLGAGPRALLLQLAHPSVAAGVSDHSNFRADPWARLAGTLRSYLRIVFGTTLQARAEIRRLHALHRDIRGTTPNGATYDARDPELALWVHATLIDSTMATADAWLSPMARDARARAYAESLPVGRAFGIPEGQLPADIAAFDAYVARMLGPGGPVRPGPLARELAAAVLRPPLGPAVRTLTGPLTGMVAAPLVAGIWAMADRLHPAAVSWLMWPAVGLLPPSIRDDYGLRQGPLERAVSTWLVTSWRVWNSVLPPPFRQMPQALEADRRVAVGRSQPASRGGPPPAL